VLTFDDGYLDNWSHAAPLLEKYGFTGTVLATVEFVDPDPVVRPTLRDVWAGTISRNELDVRAFMSWQELRAAAESGVLDVQSHALTHTWYPVSDRVVDFHHPGDAYYWLDWNANPTIKPRYLKHLGDSWVPYGVPVYAHEKSLKCRRYFPDPAESEHMAAWVHERGGNAFFDQPDWRDVLRAELNAFRSRGDRRGRMETDAERAGRIESELADSRDILADKLGRSIEFLVWPGGGYDEYSLDIARRHYRATTVSSAERWRYRNRAGENPGMIVRRGAPTFRWNGRTAAAPGGYIVDVLDEFRGSRWARRRRQFRKIALVAAARSRLWRPRP
jgi:peptidoglycan/xylan/chitin deacetylase (PgdA/CDA1 family)